MRERRKKRNTEKKKRKVERREMGNESLGKRKNESLGDGKHTEKFSRKPRSFVDYL